VNGNRPTFLSTPPMREGEREREGGWEGGREGERETERERREREKARARARDSESERERQRERASERERVRESERVDLCSVSIPECIGPCLRNTRRQGYVSPSAESRAAAAGENKYINKKHVKALTKPYGI
jgi:hypothetical protein